MLEVLSSKHLGVTKLYTLRHMLAYAAMLACCDSAAAHEVRT